MPLSEYEQRVLEQMEQQLRSDDPRLADAIAGKPMRRTMHMVLGTLAILAGLGMLVGGAAVPNIWLGVGGFLAMFGGVLLALSQPKVGSAPASRATDAPSNVLPLKRRSSGFMQRLEERWDRRRREGR